MPTSYRTAIPGSIRTAILKDGGNRSSIRIPIYPVGRTPTRSVDGDDRFVAVADGYRGGDRRSMMSAKAGETAQKTGDFYCAKCSEKVHATKGDRIPKCPNGHSEFESRRNEPGNK